MATTSVPIPMSIYHLSAKIISRRDGRSVVAAAAYRAAARLYDQVSGVTHDYSRKLGVAHVDILAPLCAPEWVYDRQKLWNAVESIERRIDAQLARELEIALPVELSSEEQVDLVVEYTKRAFVSRGMIADIAIHRESLRNPHLHLMLTTRLITPAGFGIKQHAWSKVESLLEWRRLWAELSNARLSRIGVAGRIDQRSLAAQGIGRAPGKKKGAVT